MSLADHKILSPITHHQDSPTVVIGQASTMKALFDQGAEDIRLKLNAVIDEILSQEGAEQVGIDSAMGLGNNLAEALTAVRTYMNNGADSISSDTIGLGSGNTVRSQLVWLMSQLQTMVLGQIPNGTITAEKLSLEFADSISGIGDLGLLTTENKDTLVEAINEIVNSMGDLDFVNSIAIGNTADPNTTVEPYIVTNHANSPDSANYWHIKTDFYSEQTVTADRAQVAVSYDTVTPLMYIRHFNSETWTAWQKILRQTEYDALFQSVVDGKQEVVDAINGIVGDSGLTTESLHEDYAWWITNRVATEMSFYGLTPQPLFADGLANPAFVSGYSGGTIIGTTLRRNSGEAISFTLTGMTTAKTLFVKVTTISGSGATLNINTSNTLKAIGINVNSVRYGTGASSFTLTQINGIRMFEHYDGSSPTTKVSLNGKTITISSTGTDICDLEFFVIE